MHTAGQFWCGGHLVAAHVKLASGDDEKVTHGLQVTDVVTVAVGAGMANTLLSTMRHIRSLAAGTVRTRQDARECGSGEYSGKGRAKHSALKVQMGVNDQLQSVSAAFIQREC
jgi:hypothetical protein